MKQTHHIGYVQTPSVKNLSNVKNALVENGLVPLTTPNEMLPDAIENTIKSIDPNNIKASATILGVKGKLINDWEDVNWNDISYTTYYDKGIYYSKNGIDAYGNVYTPIKKGLYHINLLTGEETKISDNYFRKFFQDNEGNVYATNPSSGYDLLKLVGASKYVLASSYKEWKNMFVSSKGEIYFVNNNNLVYVDGNKGKKITLEGSNWEYIFENSKGNIYLGSSTSYGVYKLNKNEATQLIEEPKHTFMYFFEDSKGTVYASGSTSGAGIYTIIDDVVAQIYTTGYSFTTFYEAKNGNIFSSPNNTFSSGSIAIIDGTIKKMGTSEVNLNFIETSKGVVYCTSSNVSGLYILNTDEGTLTKKLSYGRNVKNLFETKKGDIYIYNGNDSYTYFISNDGIYKSITTRIDTIFEDSQSNIYGSLKGINNNYLSKLDGSAGQYTTISDTTVVSKFFETPYGVVALSSETYSKSSKAVLIIGTETYEIEL